MTRTLRRRGRGSLMENLLDAALRHPRRGPLLPARGLPDRPPAHHRADHPACATPIAFGALCGVMCERSGVVNIGIEGMMLVGRLRRLVRRRRSWPPSLAPRDAAALRRHAGTPRRALRRRRWPGCSSPLLHAWLSVTVRADQIISGTIINIAGLRRHGLPRTLIVSSNSPPSAGKFDALRAARRADRPARRGLALRACPRTRDRITMPSSSAGHRPPGAALPLALGPAHAGRRRASQGRRDGRRRRHPAALPQRHPGRHLRRPRGRLAEPRGDRHHSRTGMTGGPRLHRAGGTHLRPLDAARRVRGGPPLRGRARRWASPSDFAPPTGQLGDLLRPISRASSGLRSPTS